jgi:hypothetical protein
VDVSERDAHGPAFINTEALLDAAHESTHGRMQSIAERRRTDEYCLKVNRLVRLLLDQNAIDSTHLAAVSIDHALIQNIPNDIHVSLRRSPAE